MALVLQEVTDGVATLTLNLPEKFNPIARELLVELREALTRVAADRQVRAVILTGAGKAFCSGADLSQIMQPSAGGATVGEETARWMENITNPLILQLRNLPVPLVCAVNGAAAGAGVGLALTGDVVVAAQSAYFYLSFLPRLGISLDLGTSWMLPRLVGPARAMGMALLDQRLSAEEARQWGLIWSCMPDAQLREEAWQIAQRLARIPAHAVQEARRAFDLAERHSMAQQLQHEADRQRELVGGPAFVEGVQAFLAKRAPVFPPR